MKLKTRMIVLNMGVALVLFFGIIGYTLINTYNTTKEDSIKLINQVALKTSKDMQNVLESAYRETRLLAHTFVTMKQGGNKDRELVKNVLKNKLQENKDFTYAWVIWEKNAFDNDDVSYRGKKGSTREGRFMPSWGKSNGSLILNTIADGFEQAEYYKVPKENKKPFFADPATYNLDGKDITTVTFSYPMVLNGKLLGVVGIDISTNDIEKINNEVKFFESGFGRLITEKGVLVAHPNEDRCNKISSEFVEQDGASKLSKIKMGQGFEEYSKSEHLGKKAFKFYEPLKIADIDKFWTYSVVVPKDEMMAEVNKMLRIMILVAILGISVMGVILYKNSHYIVSFIDAAAGHAKILASGDFSKEVPKEYLDMTDELGDFAKSFKDMTDNSRALISDITTSASQVAASSEELTATADQVSTATEEVAKTIEELAKGATEQAADTERGSQKAQELGEYIEKEKEKMQELNESSDRVIGLVDEGLKVIDELIEKTNQSGEASKEINDVIIETNKSSEKIGQASTVIASIAEQTNLLALNAAIEAARAGEAGKGFAVVAEEIRKLAEQSTQSTGEIDMVVNDLVKNAGTAVSKMEEVSAIVVKQVDSVKETEQKYRNIATAINESGRVISELNEAEKQMEKRKNEIMEIIQNLSAMAQENAASTEEASATTEEQSASMEEVSHASQELATLAQDLQKSISKFKV